MTYSSPSSLSRASSLLLSAGIHAAIGLALFAGMVAGTPDRSGEKRARGDALVVELVPLPEGGVPGETKAQSRVAASTSRAAGPAEAIPSPRGAAQQSSAPAQGNERKDDPVDGEEATSAARGAPAPDGAEIQAFRAVLLRHIERFQEYPTISREKGEQGHVRVRFVMDRTGAVVEVWIETSSGSRHLDAESLAAIRRAQPLPSPPSHWPQSFEIVLPISFSLR